MTEYGLELVDLTGRWVGFYRHRWQQLGTYPIVADLNQNDRYMSHLCIVIPILDRKASLEYTRVNSVRLLSTASSGSSG